MISKYREDPSALVFRDLFMMVAGTFAAIAIMLLFYINPVGIEQTEEFKLPGAVALEASWDPENTIDVDMAIRDPFGDVTYFRNTSTRTFDLLRDDRGEFNDEGVFNYEHAFSRGLVDGEYVVNLLLYSINNGMTPQTVQIKLWTRGETGIPELKHEAEIDVEYVGQEVTGLRFKVVDGEVDGTSFSQDPFRIIPPAVFQHETEKEVPETPPTPDGGYFP